MAKLVSTLDVFHALSTVIEQYKGKTDIIKVKLSDLELLRDSLAAELDENQSLQEQLKKEREAHKKELDGLVTLLATHKKQAHPKPNPFDTRTYPPMVGRDDAWVRNIERVMEKDKVTLASEVGAKHDRGKLRYSLLPKGTITEVLKVLEFGAKKYAPDNWKKVDNAQTRYYDAALRHITAWHEGEKLDSETGVSHIAHALCCLHFLMWFELENTNG